MDCREQVKGESTVKKILTVMLAAMLMLTMTQAVFAES